MERLPRVLTIAGSDSCGGAGVQMDLKVFSAMGAWGTCAVTSVTAQSTRGVEKVHHLPPRFLAAQIDAVAGDIRPDAVKTGMLGRAQTVSAAADRIRRRRLGNLVVDPVIRATDGTPLLSPRAVKALRDELFPLARVITPNVPESEELSGVQVTDPDSMRAAARSIATGAGGQVSVVVKGGHLEGAAVDVLFHEGQFHEFERPRLPVGPVHGTGCIYSAALAVRLAWGDTVPEACAAAGSLMQHLLPGASAVGKGALVSMIGITGRGPAAEGSEEVSDG